MVDWAQSIANTQRCLQNLGFGALTPSYTSFSDLQPLCPGWLAPLPQAAWNVNPPHHCRGPFTAVGSTRLGCSSPWLHSGHGRCHHYPCLFAALEGYPAKLHCPRGSHFLEEPLGSQALPHPHPLRLVMQPVSERRDQHSLAHL